MNLRILTNIASELHNSMENWQNRAEDRDVWQAHWDELTESLTYTKRLIDLTAKGAEILGPQHGLTVCWSRYDD